MTKNSFCLFRDPTATAADRIAQLSGRKVIEKRERTAGESLLHVCARRGLLPEAAQLLELALMCERASRTGKSSSCDDSPPISLKASWKIK